MPLYDIDGTATGTATVAGSPTLILDIVDPILGSSNVSGDTQGVFDVSGYLVGSGDLIHDAVKDVAAFAGGGSSVSADLLRWIGVRGFTIGSGGIAESVPDPILGVGDVTAYLDLVHVPLPICEMPTVQAVFRWGRTFTWGDLVLQVDGAVCVNYTLFQMQPGCQWKQIGPANRTPVKYKPGCYYVTGTAGECGQPGLWAVQWSWQRTYNDPVVEELCYFQVVDYVTCPVPGDTLERYCKYGWD